MKKMEIYDTIFKIKIMGKVKTFFNSTDINDQFTTLFDEI
jgi:hypothetical protein